MKVTNFERARTLSHSFYAYRTKGRIPLRWFARYGFETDDCFCVVAGEISNEDGRSAQIFPGMVTLVNKQTGEVSLEEMSTFLESAQNLRMVGQIAGEPPDSSSSSTAMRGDA